MEINNNEDEADNINRNLLNNNNNNNNNNINNNNNENNQAEIINRIRNRNNNQIIEDEQGALFLSKYSIFSFSFIIIFLMTIIFWIIEKYEVIEQYKFVFETDAIIFRNQYYRLISRYFVHFGIGHLIIELFIALFLLYLYENIYGSLFSLFFIIIAMFINSLIQITISVLLFYYIYYFKIDHISIYNYEGGFAPILFALNTFLTLFDNSYINENNFPTFVFFKSPYSSFYILVIIAFFTPNRSFIGNLSGILTAYFIRYFKISFLPKISWIIAFENLFKLNGDFGTIYRNINNNNIIMKKILNQFEENCIRDDDKDKKEEIDKIEKSNDINSRNNDLINIEESHEQIEMSFINNQSSSRNN